jgi:hypothetical protein
MSLRMDAGRPVLELGLPSARGLALKVKGYQTSTPHLSGLYMDYFVPSLLNTLVGEPEAEANKVLNALARPVIDASKFTAKDSLERGKIESDRLYRVALMFEALTEKYDNAVRSRRLLEEARQGKRSMVLFLRGFSYQVTDDLDSLGVPSDFASALGVGSIGFSSDLSEHRFRFDLARKLAPTPIFLIRNPAMSEPLVEQFPGADTAAANTFSLEADDTWLSTVQALIDIASFIVIYNNEVHNGLVSEVDLLRTLNRLDDTYFSHSPQQEFKLSADEVRRADDDALAQISRSIRPRPDLSGSLPPPTCWWVQGDRRQRVRDNVLTIYDLFNKWAAQGQNLPLDMQVRLLHFAVAGSVILERLDLLFMSLYTYGYSLQGYGKERLPEFQRLSKQYFWMAEILAKAIDITPSERPILDYVDLPALKTLAKNETPEILIPYTMRVIEHMPERLSLHPED